MSSSKRVKSSASAKPRATKSKRPGGGQLSRRPKPVGQGPSAGKDERPSPPAFALRDEEAHGVARQNLTRGLFDRIAKSYDRMNLVLSLGSDPRWKRLLIRLLPPAKKPVCLDLACGTGDLMFALAKKYPDGQITGVDISPGMLAEAKRRAKSEAPTTAIRTVEHAMETAPIKAASVDLLTAGYALRNSADLPLLLNQIAKWVKPGGTAAFLEFSKPRSKIIQALELSFLWVWGGLWGLLVQKNRHIYQYLGESLKRHPDHPSLLAAFQSRGFEITEDRALYFGILRLTVARRLAKKRTRK